MGHLIESYKKKSGAKPEYWITKNGKGTAIKLTPSAVVWYDGTKSPIELVMHEEKKVIKMLMRGKVKNKNGSMKIRCKMFIGKYINKTQSGEQHSKIEWNDGHVWVRCPDAERLGIPLPL